MLCRDQMAPKRKFPFQQSYVETYGLRITARHAATSDVESCICRFCESFGREDDGREQSTGEPARKRKKTTNNQHWNTSFRPDNILKHMRAQHANKYEEYLNVLKNKDDSPVAFKTFFTQTVVESFLEKQAMYTGGSQRFTISKDIVEVVIRDMMFDEEEVLSGDIAMKAFVPNFNLRDNGSKQLIDYRVITHNRIQLDYVASLLAAGLSFQQISRVIKENRERLGTGAKTGCVSPGDASSLARIICAVCLQMISDLMYATWAFAIAADVSTDNSGSSHLDTRIRLAPVSVNCPDIISFHLLEIPLFQESHSGESLFDHMSKFLNAMCSNWRDKLIGSTSDGAPNMTGCVQGFSTRLQRAVSSSVFYRVWCLAHQLDLIVKAGSSGIADVAKFQFIGTMTTTVSWLRRQDALIRRMKCKCPYLIQVRWTSLAKVLNWLISNRVTLCDFFAEKRYASAPSKEW
jgi:hypothetical protein